MKLRPFLPAASLALASLAAVLIWNVISYQRAGSSQPAGVSISGRVVATDATAMKDVQVRVRWLENGQVRSITVPVKPDGSFTADGLEPGYYTVQATAPGEGDGSVPRTFASADVRVGNASVSGVVLQSTPAGR